MIYFYFTGNYNYVTRRSPSSGAQLFKKFPVFYLSWRFITAFTKAFTSSYSEPDNFSLRTHSPPSYFTKIHLILFSHLCLGLLSDTFHSAFLLNTACAAPLPYIIDPIDISLKVINVINIIKTHEVPEFIQMLDFFLEINPCLYHKPRVTK